MPKGAMKFKSMTVGKQNGELARFRVLGGPDSGVVFVVTSPRVTIGRAEDNDLILTDIKASRKHAELTLQGGVATLRDIGSTHGFLVNGTPQRQIQLNNGDKLGIGGTVLEFIATSGGGATQMIVRPPVQTAKTVGTGNSGLTQFIPRPTAGPGSGKSTSAALGLGGAAKAAGQPQSFIERNKKVMILLVGLMGLASLMPEAEKNYKAKRGVSSYVTPGDATKGEPPVLNNSVDYDSPAFKSADVYHQLGKREFTARNYLRAMTAFETALQIYSAHPLAQVYLKSTKAKMEEEAKAHLNLAKRDESSIHYRQALNRYNAVKRLFANDQSHKYYKEADVKAVEIEKKLKEMERR